MRLWEIVLQNLRELRLRIVSMISWSDSLSGIFFKLTAFEVYSVQGHHFHTIYKSPAHPTLWQEMPAKVLTCEMINVIVKRSLSWLSKNVKSSSSWLSKCNQIISNETLPHSHINTWSISNPTNIPNHGHHSLVLSLPSATRVTDCQYCNAHFWKVQDEVEPWKEILVIHKRTTTKREDQKILWRTKTMSHCDHMWSHAHDLVTVWQNREIVYQGANPHLRASVLNVPTVTGPCLQPDLSIKMRDDLFGQHARFQNSLKIKFKSNWTKYAIVTSYHDIP